MNTPSNPTTPALTCKGCDHYDKTFCKLYGSIINFDNPITSCHKRKGAK